MEVFRFMSKEEFEKYENGETLINNNQHFGRRTTSEGFCFLGCKEHEPHEALHFLAGIVSLDVCAVFETDEKFLKKTKGIYRICKKGKNYSEDLINLRQNKQQEINEYCTIQYDKTNFKLIKYSEHIDKQWDLPYRQKEFNWNEV